MSENDLVKGMFFKTPHDNAPDFVKRKVSVNVDQFIEYLNEHKNESGYVNFDLLEAKSLHWYLKLDDWKPDSNYSGGNSSSSGSTWGSPKEDKPKIEGGFKPTFTPPKEEFEDDIPF